MRITTRPAGAARPRRMRMSDDADHLSLPRQPDYHVAHHRRTKGCRKNAFSKIGAPTRDGKIQKAI
jgi:hypothetical protein